MNPEQFQQALADHGITLSAEQMQQFADYYQLLVETNEHVNLTRITEKDEVYLKHFYDSITGKHNSLKTDRRATARAVTISNFSRYGLFLALKVSARS